MNTSYILQMPEFKLLTEAGEHREILDLYCGDLLSWVMSHAQEDDAWITVQTHANVVAIASLLNIACIIVPEDIEVESSTIEKANEVGIIMIATSLKAYEIFKKLYEAGLK